MDEFTYGAPVGAEVQVNTIVQGTQDQPQVAALSGGGYVIVWRDDSRILNATSEVRGQRYDANGAAVGGEFLINQMLTTSTLTPRVSGTPDGGFVVTWGDSALGIRGRAFDAAGAPETDEYRIEVNGGTGASGGSSVAASGDGDYLVTWQTVVPASGGTPQHTEVRGRLFGADDQPRTGEITFGLTDAQPRGAARVAAGTDGGFLVTWADGRSINGQNLGSEVFAQRLDGAGVKVGDEFRINVQSTGAQSAAVPVALAGGGYLITWVDTIVAGQPPVIKARRFGADGAPAEGEIVVAAVDEGALTSTPVAVALPDGRFAVSWSVRPAGSTADTLVTQLLDADGFPQGERLSLPDGDGASEFAPTVAVLASGRIVGAWVDGSLEAGATGGSLGIRARLFDLFAVIEGTEAAEAITGTDASEIIDASDGADRVFALSGDDQIDAGEGADEVDGGAGDDLILGDDGNDVLTGGFGFDTLFGESGDDLLIDRGNASTPSRDGGTLDGGTGDDVIEAANGGFALFGGTDDDDFGSGGDDRLTLVNGLTGSSIDGEDGDDVIRASGSGTIFIRGGDGADDVRVEGFAAGIVDGGGGADRIALDRGGMSVFTGSGADVVTITPGAGGLTFADFKAGEAGDRVDLSVFGADPFDPGGSLTIAQSGQNTVIEHAASGARYFFTGVIAANLSAFNLGVANPLFAPQGATIDDAFANQPEVPFGSELVGADGDDLIRGFGGDDVLFGAGGNDRLEGGADADALFGGSGDDVIDGGDGADLLNGGLGADRLFGGAGDDVVAFTERAFVGQVPAGLVDGGEGFDTVDLRALASASLGSLIFDGSVPALGIGSRQYELVGVERILFGDGVDAVTIPAGFASALELRLGGGADFLSVRGSSSVFGEAGDDDFILFGAMSAATSGVVDGGEGTDRLTLSTGFTFDLATGIARGGDATYAVSGFERFIATTNGATSTILGNDAANSFEVSFFGNDGRAGVVFDGRGGADSLSGSVGADTLSGGDGNDSIDGRAGDDLIDGGLGNDFMIGGAGNDTYVVSSFDDRVNEFAGAGEGEDEVVTALQGYYLPFAVERLTLIGAGNLLGVGNALNNRLTGNAGANELYGLDGADVVLGLAGADTLGGGAGDDRIEGGSDGDFLYGDAGRDQLDGGDGLDMLYGGEGDDILQGGAGADLMLGAAGDDRLDGGDGADVMRGGAGGDVFVIDDAGDQALEKAGEGTDRAEASVSYTLSNSVEALTLVGAAAIDGTGNVAANSLTGNAGANRLSGLRGDDLLDGGAGDDVLVGGQGMDRLTGSAGADRFVFAPGETGRNATTADRVLDFTSADGDRIDLTGYDADMSTAGDDAFRFIGTRAFSGGAGELRVRALGGELFVQGDTNGDGTADFMINMGAVPMMAATDFLL